MIGVAGQSKPRLLSRSSRPAAAAFRIDQDARCAEMSESVKGFGCRPLEGRHRMFGGRRPKASKEGNRA